ncbi:MAG: UbiD family decarboxylase domain-containing protein, partial [Phycisphaeraceae bacterium]
QFKPQFDPWPQGKGRYITFGGVYTIHPDDADKPHGTPRPSRNVGMYRAQLIDRNHTAMHWHIHHDGARHWRAWKARGEGQGPRAMGHGDNPQSAIRNPQSVGPWPSSLGPSPGMPCAIVLGGESVLPYAGTAPLPPGISEL